MGQAFIIQVKVTPLRCVTIMLGRENWVGCPLFDWLEIQAQWICTPSSCWAQLSWDSKNNINESKSEPMGALNHHNTNLKRHPKSQGFIYIFIWDLRSSWKGVGAMKSVVFTFTFEEAVSKQWSALAGGEYYCWHCPLCCCSLFGFACSFALFI